MIWLLALLKMTAAEFVPDLNTEYFMADLREPGKYLVLDKTGDGLTTSYDNPAKVKFYPSGDSDGVYAMAVNDRYLCRDNLALHFCARGHRPTEFKLREKEHDGMRGIRVKTLRSLSEWSNECFTASGRHVDLDDCGNYIIYQLWNFIPQPHNDIPQQPNANTLPYNSNNNNSSTLNQHTSSCSDPHNSTPNASQNPNMPPEANQPKHPTSSNYQTLSPYPDITDLQKSKDSSSPVMDSSGDPNHSNNNMAPAQQNNNMNANPCFNAYPCNNQPIPLYPANSATQPYYNTGVLNNYHNNSC